MARLLRGLRSSLYLKVAVISVIAMTALVAAFDWNWLRGPLVRYLSEKAGREIQLADLHVHAFSLHPTIRLRGLYIENARWAADRPFVKAAEVSFTVSLRSLWERRPVISRVVLVDAEVDMEREANGLRNWRLKAPDDRSPGRLTVHALEAHRSTVRFVNREIDFEFVGTSTPVQEPTSDGLSSRITFHGSYQGAPYAGVAFTSGVMSFRGSGIVFPMRGEMKSRNARVDVDGLFSDIFDLGTFDAKLRVSGASLAEVHPFLRIRPPPSRPFWMEAQLTQAANVYEFRQFKGKVGTTDLAGEVTYDRSGARPRLKAALASEAADVIDLRALLGMRDDAQRAGAATHEKNPGRAADTSHSRVLPAKPLRVERLQAVDVALDLDAKKLHSAAIAMLDSLRVKAELAGGVLELKALDLGAAGGHIVGALTLDARQRPASARTRLELRALELARLLPKLAGKARASGEIGGRIQLSGEGDSVAAILGNSTGSVVARLKGGSISNIADAKLGLNVGKMFALMLRGDRDIAIHCGIVAFDLKHGAGRSRDIALDTAQTHTDGMGSVDLRKEYWELLLTPQPKHPGLFTRHASIRVNGSFRDADVSIDERVPLRGSDQADGAAAESPSRACAESR